ncbi:MAG TPA: T9SS type A sorting domain-containing protein, partial [Bacteroidetes bacterium]|nr:T9SS type A sorting domain-containing protein [Bacteroidota bacterium]
VWTIVPSSCHPEPVEGRGTNNKYSVIWNGTDNNNQPVSSGIYFVKLKAGQEIKSKKILLLK